MSVTRITIKKVIEAYKKRGLKYVLFTAKKIILDGLFSPVEQRIESELFSNMSQYLILTPVNFTKTGNIRGKYLIGTQSGILFLDNDNVIRITCGSTYGITRIRNTFIARQVMNKFYRIISFELAFHSDKPQLNNLKVIAVLKNHSPHQIDAYKGKIYIAEAHANRLLIIDCSTGKREYVYPAGKFRNGGSSKNYCHFNSIFVKDEIIYLLAHNKTSFTGKKSEIFILDASSYKVKNIIKTMAGNAHNVVPYNNTILYCDSMRGSLMEGERVLFKDENYFTRGLSVTKDNLVLGGSELAEREARNRTSGIVWVLNKEGRVEASTKLEGIGSLFEIRSLKEDFALSEQ